VIPQPVMRPKTTDGGLRAASRGFPSVPFPPTLTRVMRTHPASLSPLVLLAFLLATPACAGAAAVAALPSPLEPALSAIDTNDLFRHTRVLASDEFEGRAPGSAGEDKAVRYLADEFRRLGLEPGNPDGSWFQPVPLVGIQSTVKATLTRPRTGGGEAATEDWQFPQDYVAWSPRMREQVALRDSELVFVGYGVVAPEYQWDDFKDVDVRGKTLVMLVNDPPIPDPARPGELDPTQFRGRAMTYYGRWTYKFEIAAAKGAAAALVIHETGPAGYPYFVVVNSWGRENFDLATPDGNTNKVALAGWLSLDRARALVAAGGQDFDTLKRAALRRDFRPVPLGASVSFDIANRLREVPSRNVVARLPGAHPERRNEVVVYSSHWDHLGRDERLDGDRIFNGALDNATGVAALLELAEAFVRAPRRPDRTVLFLAVTAEEQGLLGAKHYAEHPLYPLERTLANLNLDGANVAGRQRDIGVVGAGLNTLEDLLATAATSQDRVVRPEAEPEKGGYYRSDHFEFAKVGVPALYLDKTSDDILGRPPGYGKQRRDEYRDRDYHKVTDEVKPWWDLAGAVDDTRLLFLVGWEVAHTSRWPEWKPGAEFKARRDAGLRRP
jgi:Zn-dependent M28 family amino/carboxypeptidase